VLATVVLGALVGCSPGGREPSAAEESAGQGGDVATALSGQQGGDVTSARAGGPAEPLSVIATTTLVGDVVSRVGGDIIDLTVLLPVGADPHGFTASPRDVAAVSGADVVFVSGLSLETFLDPLLENAGGGYQVVSVSDGVATITAGDESGDESSRETAGGHDHAIDPHVWMDPGNVMIWASNVARALGELDPQAADGFAARAAAYQSELAELDNWIHDTLSTVPSDRRLLVTDHETFGYFAKRYGFEQVGTVIPGLSALAEPSARDLAALEDRIVDLEVPAILVGSTVNPRLAEQLSADTGTRVVTVYTGSLSAPGGPADTYVNLMRHNVAAIAEALR
jgi:ABC-type Zn uptake system ZnuABC Zn-binding protein ZnuA